MENRAYYWVMAISLNVPLQTIGHAWAGIRGMPRIYSGAGGAFTSRDAKPNGLESCFGTPLYSLIVINISYIIII